MYLYLKSKYLYYIIFQFSKEHVKPGVIISTAKKYNRKEADQNLHVQQG